MAMLRQHDRSALTRHVLVRTTASDFILNIQTLIPRSELFQQLETTLYACTHPKLLHSVNRFLTVFVALDVHHSPSIPAKIGVPASRDYLFRERQNSDGRTGIIAIPPPMLSAGAIILATPYKYFGLLFREPARSSCRCFISISPCRLSTP